MDARLAFPSYCFKNRCYCQKPSYSQNHYSLIFSLLLVAFLLTVTPSVNATIDVLKQQAQLNNADAQYQLGLAYETGEGVASDLSLAAYWYKQASENHHVAASFNFAQALEQGRGVQTNRAKAVLLYTKLAAQGETLAFSKIARLYRDYDITINNDDRVVLWYSLAKEFFPRYESDYAAALEQQFNRQQLRQMNALRLKEEKTNLEFLDAQPDNTQSINIQSVKATDPNSTLPNPANSQLTKIHPINEVTKNTSTVHIVYGGLLAMSLCVGCISFARSKRKIAQNQHQINDMRTSLLQQQQMISSLKSQLKHASQFAHARKAQSTPPQKQHTQLSDAFIRFGFTPKQVESLTPQTVKARYKQLCRVFHPDRQGSDEEMKQLNLALNAIVSHLKTKV